jgi:exopolysaccharide biosynthesis polyprenyl glycosylphosphotransferase
MNRQHTNAVHASGRPIRASRLTPCLGTAFVLLAVASIFSPDVYSGLLWSVFTLVGLLLPLRPASQGVMRSRPFTERVLLVGASPLARKLIDELDAQRDCRAIIVGVVDDPTVGDGPSRLRYPVVGPLERLDKVIADVRPDRIIVALTDRPGRVPVRHLVHARAGGVAVDDGVEVLESITGKIAIDSRAPTSLVVGQRLPNSRATLAVARGMSLVAAVVGLVGLALVIGLIALAIKLDSPGPVFVVQDRVGLRGKRFKLIKFRTMHPISGETPLWFQDSFNRITSVGKWLRRFRLDELPQFVNILRGDMNLIGPRPHRVPKFELFAATTPYFGLRSLVRPGLTGWAQVRHGYASNLEEETEKTWYDLYYIEHMSPLFDLRILVETVKVVLLGRASPMVAPAQPEAVADLTTPQERAA